MLRVRNQEESEESRRRLAELLGARGEWVVREGASAVWLRPGEWELWAGPGGLFFSYWGEAGSRAWRVSGWECVGGKILLEASRRAGAERARLELVARASVGEGAAVVAAARIKTCQRLATLAAGHLAGARVERASLSEGSRRGEPGRYARIILRRGRALLAATGPVVALGAAEADALLVSALLWYARLVARRRASELKGLWLVAPAGLARAAGERLALLREGWRGAVSLFEVDDGLTCFTPSETPTLSELLSRPAPRLHAPARIGAGELAGRVAALAPEAVDVVRARRGETLRFRGLPFARVRRVAGRERLWFGVGEARARRPLEESNREELLKLVAELAEHRRPDAPDRAHALYRAAPEAWLEWLLRRDVSRLDPGLRLAPLHAQLRASPASGGARPLDLLALRRDGRLVVVELKVSEDAAHALQGADYWRRIYTHHLAGYIRRARLFGDAEIADSPPLVYLVAPLLRLHRSFEALARCIRPEVEMYRFDLNEDWREGVRVARRARVN